MLSYQTRELIHVKEGDRAQLNRKQFEVLFNKFNFLMLKLSIPPRNGVLWLVSNCFEGLTFSTKGLILKISILAMSIVKP